MSAHLLWVALGGALGAMTRSLITAALFVPGRFPWATLVINIAGSLAIGLVWGFGQQQPWFDSWGRPLLVVGLLGGFTTFSAFSLDTVALVETGRGAWAIAYVLASVGCCVIAAWCGQRLAT